jgi:hypothetical protein
LVMPGGAYTRWAKGRLYSVKAGILELSAPWPPPDWARTLAPPGFALVAERKATVSGRHLDCDTCRA